MKGECPVLGGAGLTGEGHLAETVPWLLDQGGPPAGRGAEARGAGRHGGPLCPPEPVPGRRAHARAEGAPRHAVPRVRGDLLLPRESGLGRGPGRGGSHPSRRCRPRSCPARPASAAPGPQVPLPAPAAGRSACRGAPWICSACWSSGARWARPPRAPAPRPAPRAAGALRPSPAACCLSRPRSWASH